MEGQLVNLLDKLQQDAKRINGNTKPRLATAARACTGAGTGGQEGQQRTKRLHSWKSCDRRTSGRQQDDNQNKHTLWPAVHKREPQ